MKFKSWVLILMIFLEAFIFFECVSAGFGIASDYSSANPLIMNSGETRIIDFGRLQNTGDKDMILEIEMTEGGEIATIKNENLNNFILPAKTTNNSLNLEISIPEDALGEYIISIRFSDITPSEESGMVTFSQSLSKSLKILVSDGKETEGLEKIGKTGGKQQDEKEIEEEFDEGIGTRKKTGNLFWIILGSLFLFLIVSFVLIYFVFRRENKEKPASSRLEVISVLGNN